MSIVGVTASSRRQVPNAPTIGTATDVGTSRNFNNGAAVVTFTPSAIGFEATSYTVTSSPGGFTATGSSSPLTVTGLQSSTNYTFTATATNFVGTGAASAASNSITATTVPQAPTIGTPTLADGQAYTGSATIGVAFTANATGGKTITGFNVLSSSAATGSGVSSPISVSETVGSARTYTVTASNANGTSLASSASAAITPSSVPQAPTINSVTNVSGRPSTAPQASVAFTANATGGSAITSFRVTSSSGLFTTGTSSPLVVTETSVGTYTYTVFATNARGNSILSAGVSVELAAVPQSFTIGTLSNVTGIPFGSNPQFTLTFTPPPAGPPSMAITDYEYSTDGGVTFAQVLNPSGGLQMSSPFTLTVASTGIRTSSYAGDPFVAGTSYTVILMANNAYGGSSPSSPSNSRVAATAPSVPTFTLSSTGITNITNTFSYNNGGLAVTSDSPALSPAISTGFGGVSPVGNTSGALTYTGSFVQGTTYTVPMSITNPIGTATATSKTIIPYAATVPSAPASLSAVVAGTTSVTLTYGAISQNGSALTAWTGSGTSTGDIVSSPAVNLTYSGTPSTAGGSVTVTGTFAAATSYTFSLRARNGVGAGTTATSGGVVPLPTITDNFNRTGSVLGTTSSGSAWTTHSGAWSTNGTQGVSSSTGVASVSFGNGTATVTADVTNGYGVSWWVTGSGSYYSSYYQQYTYTYSTGANYCTDCTYTNYSCNSSTSYSCPSGQYYGGSCYTCPSGYTFDQSTGTCKFCASGTPVCPAGTTEFNGLCWSCSSGTLYWNGTSYQCQVVSGTTGNGVYSYSGSASTYTSTIQSRYCTSANVADPYSPCASTSQCEPSASGAVCLRYCPNGGYLPTNTSSTCYLCNPPSVNGPNPSTGSGTFASCYTEGTQPAYTYTYANQESKVAPSGGTWPNCNYTVTTGPATYVSAATVTVTSGGTYPDCCCGVSTSGSTGPAVNPYPTCGCLANTASRTNTGGGAAVTPTATATGDRIITGGTTGELLASVPTKITAVTSAAGSWTVYAYNSGGTQIYTTSGTGTPVGNYGVFLGTSTVTIGTGVDNFSVS